jgi:hypothetical protein
MRLHKDTAHHQVGDTLTVNPMEVVPDPQIPDTADQTLLKVEQVPQEDPQDHQQELSLLEGTVPRGLYHQQAQVMDWHWLQLEVELDRWEWEEEANCYQV